MTTFIWFVNAGMDDGVENPSPTDVKHWFDSMENEVRFYFNVETPLVFITITNVNKDRVKFVFRDKIGDNKRVGILTDPMYSAKDGEIEYESDQEEESIHIYTTVTKTKAYEVIIYFLEHNSLPEGLSWLVSMGKI